jgi:very-short-patch-repair endonuclease
MHQRPSHKLPGDRRPSSPELNQLDGRPLATGRPDVVVASWAADDWGVLSLDELRECGLSRGNVATRVRQGRLHPVHRSVYAVGHPRLTLEGKFMAAVKAFAGDAVLSHCSAAALWRFLDWDDRTPEVTVIRTGTRICQGVRVHRTSVLEPRDVMQRQGIPVTVPARTLVDLAAVVNYTLLRRALRRGLALRRVSIPHVVAATRRLGPRRGSAKLTRALATAAPTRSELEDVLLDLIVDAGFARPDVNRPLLLAGRRVIPDFRWPEQQLVVEADSRAWHENPIARVDDRERQALLEAHGERVLRVTWNQAIRSPRETVRRIEAAGAPRPSDRASS